MHLNNLPIFIDLFNTGHVNEISWVEKEGNFQIYLQNKLFATIRPGAGDWVQIGGRQLPDVAVQKIGRAIQESKI